MITVNSISLITVKSFTLHIHPGRVYPLLAPHIGAGVQVNSLNVVGDALLSLPGLRGLLRADSVNVQSSGMTDFAWLSSLSCTRGLSMMSNSISSLEGLNQVQAVVDPASKGPHLSLATMNALTVGGVAPLRAYAACTPANTSPWGTSIRADFPCNPSVRPPPGPYCESYCFRGDMM
jgi:hypothetical protein